MSALYNMHRPSMLFDVADPQHRFYAHQFLKTKSWKGCPYSFALTNGHSSLYHMIAYELAVWYADQEFSANTVSSDLPSKFCPKFAGML